jgi:hypothetical protein
MKPTKLLLIALAFFTTAALSAQVHYGFKGGLNFAKAEFEDGPHTDYRTGYHVAAFAQYPFSGNLYVQPELQLTSKGYYYSTTILGTEVERESRPLYLEVPILLHMHGDLGNLGVFGNIGPYIAAGIGGSYYRETAFDTDEEPISFGRDDEDDQYRKVDMGLSIGAGFWVDPGFSLTLFYDHGMYNVSPSNDPDDAFYNRTMGISVGFVVD